MKYSPYYGDPIAFFAVLYFDHYELASKELICAAYASLLVVRVTMYIWFMKDMISQICDHLNIPFITVKKVAD